MSGLRHHHKPAPPDDRPAIIRYIDLNRWTEHRRPDRRREHHRPAPSGSHSPETMETASWIAASIRAQTKPRRMLGRTMIPNPRPTRYQPASPHDPRPTGSRPGMLVRIAKRDKVLSLRPLQSFPSHWEIMTNRQSDGPAPMVSPQSVYTTMLVMANYTLM